ncbi:hypothetical protein ES702_01507 [subsurface metagenome]
MVNRKSSIYTTLLFVTILLIMSLVSNIGFVKASNIEYHLEHEWAKIWINQDGTIDLLYDISITCDSGIIHYVNVGQPKSDFTIGTAKDEAGHTLTATDAGESRVRVDLYTPISTGQTVRFNLTTNVAHMIWEDEDNPENVGMEFIPCWWGADVKELRVLVVLPQGVTKENIQCTPDWDNAYYDTIEDNRLALYWERYNLQPNQEFPCGVSFPKEYVQHYEIHEKGFEWLLPVVAFLFIALVIGIIVYKRVPLRKYVNPSMRMEALGIRHGLTAVEASHLLDLPPTKIVTEILYSLLMKKAIWVTATTPALKLKVMEPFKDKTGTPETPLRYYEKSFLKAVKKDGPLKEEKLAETVVLLRDTVEKKLRGYCRRDTINYYKKVVGEAWEQVKKAGTPELASKAYDENLLWLLLHEGFSSRTEDVFREKMFEPGIGWWWYWYGYTAYHPHPTYKPSPTTTQPTSPPTIPGADFANNIATSVEKTANNIVANVEKFANSIVPAPPPSAKTSKAPAHHKSDCACACAACACVCACVSCACACASGGVG